MKQFTSYIISPHPQQWFVAAALIFGVCFTFATPLFKVPDELGHATRAYSISEGGWIGTLSNGKSGSFVPDSIRVVSDYSATHSPLSSLRDLQATPLINGKTVFYEHPNLVLYSPLVYAPQAIGFVIARAARLPAVDALYLARLMNLFAYVALVWLAIRLIPFAKWAVVVIGLLPMHILLAGSMSADPVSVGLIGLMVAVVLALRERVEPVTRKQYLWLLGLAAAMSLTKLPVPLLLLLFLLVPQRIFGDTRKKWWKHIAGLAAVAVVVGGCWLLGAKHALVPYGPAGVDTALQIHNVVSHPLGFIKALLATFFSPASDGFLGQYVVSIGYVAATVPLWITCLYGIFLAFVVFPLRTNSRAAFTRGQKIAIGSLVAGIVAIITILLYLSWTPVSARVVDGMQARYLTPLLFLLAPLMTVRRTKKNEQDGSLKTPWYQWGTVIFLVASLFMSIYFFYLK